MTSLKDLRRFLHRFALIGLWGTLGTTRLALAAAVDLYAVNYAVLCGPSCSFPSYNPIFRFDSATGAPLGPFAAVVNPQALAFGPDGNLYASDVYTESVLRFDGATGAPLGSIPVVNPAGLAFGPDGNLYVAGRQAGSIFRFDGRTGAFLGTFASVVNPVEIMFGPDGNLYVISPYIEYKGILRFDDRTGAPLGTFIADAGLFTFGPSSAIPEPAEIVLTALVVCQD